MGLAALTTAMEAPDFTATVHLGHLVYVDLEKDPKDKQPRMKMRLCESEGDETGLPLAHPESLARLAIKYANIESHVQGVEIETEDRETDPDGNPYIDDDHWSDVIQAATEEHREELAGKLRAELVSKMDDQIEFLEALAIGRPLPLLLKYERQIEEAGEKDLTALREATYIKSPELLGPLISPGEDVLAETLRDEANEAVVKYVVWELFAYATARQGEDLFNQAQVLRGKGHYETANGIEQLGRFYCDMHLKASNIIKEIKDATMVMLITYCKAEINDLPGWGDLDKQKNKLIVKAFGQYTCPAKNKLH